MADAVDTYLLSEARRSTEGAVQPGELPPRQPGQKPCAFVFVLVPGHVRQEALQAAIRRLKDLEIPAEFMGYEAVRDEERWQLLWRVMRDPRTHERERDKLTPWRWRPICRKVDDLRELVTEEERDKLWNDYLDFAEAFDPQLDRFTPEEAEGVRVALKKKDLAGLVSCGSSSLANYLRTLADPFTTCSTASSSPGSGSDQGPSTP